MVLTPALKTKGDRTRLINTLNKLMFEAARDKDWQAVTILSAAIYVVLDRGEI